MEMEKKKSGTEVAEKEVGNIVTYRENIVCPHCNGEQSSESYERFSFEDGEQHGLFCSKCGKNFYVRVERPIEYAISKEPI